MSPMFCLSSPADSSELERGLPDPVPVTINGNIQTDSPQQPPPPQSNAW